MAKDSLVGIAKDESDKEAFDELSQLSQHSIWYRNVRIDLEVYGINVNNIKDEDLIEQENLQRETALMYSKLMAKMHEDNQQNSQLNKSPPIAAQVMAHISSKLVALMHESESEVEQPTTPTASSRFVFSFSFLVF